MPSGLDVKKTNGRVKQANVLLVGVDGKRKHGYPPAKQQSMNFRRVGLAHVLVISFLFAYRHGAD